MMIPVVLVGFAAMTAVLYRHLRAKPGPRALWRSAFTIGATVGVSRAVLACAGWYGVEHTGGPLQIPAYMLALLAWPEAVALGRYQGQAAPRFYAALAAVLMAGTLLYVVAVALAAQAARGGAARADEP